MQRHPETLFDGILEAHVQGRAAGIQKAQLRCVQGNVLVARVFQQTGEHRWHALHQGDAVFGQRPRQFRGVKARLQMQRRATVKARQADRGEAKHMGNRQHRIDPVITTQVPQPAGGAGDVQQVAVGEHHAFGGAGGPGGVDHRRHLPGRVRFYRFNQAGVVEGSDVKAAQVGNFTCLCPDPFGVACGTARGGTGK
ncbi:hypothetical protein D3C84_684260 [compost metagenome]